MTLMLNLLDLNNFHEILFSIDSALSFVPSVLVSALCTISAILVVYFSTKYRNGEHKVLYYVLSLFFPLIVLIVFAIKRKEMNGVGMKVCPSCHRKYPQEFVTCYQCNIELPPYDAKKKNREKAAAIIMSAIFAVTCAFSVVQTCVSLADTAVTMLRGGFPDSIDDNDDIWDDPWGTNWSSRRGFKDENGNMCYYDMKGEVYSEPDDVVLYTKDGVKYVYSNATEKYQGTDGNSVGIFNAFVDEDG